MADNPVTLPSGVEFLALRGRAIESYSTLEYRLCCLLKHLAGTSYEVAGIIFYKIINARSRNEILDKLYRAKHRSHSRLYWNAVLRAIGSLDERRNQIVHWTTIAAPGNDERDESGRAMRPGNIFSASEVPLIERDHLADFIIECQFWCESLRIFTAYLRRPLSRGEPDIDPVVLRPWLDIFPQAAVYPPPDSHPLFRWHAEAQSQRPSSQA